MGPPSIDYSITLFGGEGNETHGSLSANNVVVVHVIAALGVRSWLFEHPNVLMGHPQPGVRPVSHAGTLDLHPLNELQSLPLQLLSVPLRHPHDLAAANVVLAVNDHDAAGPKYPNTFSPDPPVRFSIRFTPLHLARIGRMERSSEGVAVRISPRPVTGVVMVGHAVPVCGARHDGIKFPVTCPRHSRRVSDVHLDMCRSLCGPLGFDLVGDDATREAVVAQQANLPDTRHRIKNALRPVFPKDTGEDRQEHVSVLGRMSWHGLDRHHRHLTYKIRPAWARSRCGPCALSPVKRRTSPRTPSRTGRAVHSPCRWTGPPDPAAPATDADTPHSAPRAGPSESDGRSPPHRPSPRAGCPAYPASSGHHGTDTRCRRFSSVQDSRCAEATARSPNGPCASR